MASQKIQFLNSGGKEYNDIVYRAKTFNVANSPFQFELRPRTPYWRFGLAFSEKDAFTFQPEKGRYNDKSLRFVQINVGDRPASKNEWELPNKLDFTTYYVDEPTTVTTIEYESLTPVRLFVEIDDAGNMQFRISFGPQLREITPINLSLPNYRFFKIFAWADWTEFNLDCIFTEEDRVIDIGPPENPTPKDPAYWIWKIRAKEWAIHDLQAGQVIPFNTFQHRRNNKPDLDVVTQVGRGDLVALYADGAYQSSVAVLQVDTGIVPHEREGGIIRLTIKKVLRPPVGFDAIKYKIDHREWLTDDETNRWISITQDEFEDMTATFVGGVTERDYLPSYTAEGSHGSTADKLDFADDIESFARVICLESVKPPMAIGLFGKWGSGKSFFMENLANRISKLKGTNSLYVKNIVQVTFNSWHYSDANLWASLITEMFDQLYAFAKGQGRQFDIEKLSETLQITSVQKQEAEAKKKLLEAKQSQLELEQQDKRDRLKDISGLDLLKTLLKDPQVQSDIQSLENENVEKIFGNKEKVESYIAQVRAFKNKLNYFFSLLFSLKGRWIWVLLVAVLIFLASRIVTLPQFDHLYNWLTFKLAGWAALITTAIGKLWAAYYPMQRDFEKAFKRLSSLKATIDARPKKENPELINTRNELEQVKASLEQIDSQIVAVTTELDEIRSGAKLLRFVEQTSKDPQYAQQLGLISRIRKDFKRLDELLRLQYEVSKDEREKLNPGDIRLKIDRIILYIDDLDRCSEDVVVRVLEAVNMLLSFQLFIVVVGVDPRWLNHSLDKTYTFFESKKISSFEYLEKIFQIPFTLKPTTKSTREELVAYLFRSELEQYRKQREPQGSTDLPPDLEVPPVDYESNDQADPMVTEEPAEYSLESRLTMSTEELDRIKDVSALFGDTPRSIKRFANIYRLVKTHHRFVPNPDPRATLLLIAIIVGYPQFSHLLAAELAQTPKMELSEFLSDTKGLADLKKILEVNLPANYISELTVVELKENLDLVARYSFRALIDDKPTDMPDQHSS